MDSNIPQLTFHRAHLGRRACAIVLDVAAYLLYYTIVGLFLLSDEEYGTVCTAYTPASLAEYTIIIFVPSIAALGCQLKMEASMGQVIVGLLIADATTGNSPEPRQLVTRFVTLDYVIGHVFLASCSATENIEALAVFALIVSALTLHAVYNENKRGVHDIVAHTVVVRKCDSSSDAEQLLV